MVTDKKMTREPFVAEVKRATFGYLGLQRSSDNT